MNERVVPFPNDKITEKVSQRVKNAEGSDGKKDGSGSGEIDSGFIIECLKKNELGDGELFKKLFRNDFVFNKSTDCWMRWTGHHWDIDKMDTALASVDKVAMVYQDEAKRVASEINKLGGDGKSAGHLEGQIKMLNNRISALRSTRRRKNCLVFAHTTENPLAIGGDEVDQRPWLLPCKNGVVNLRTGELEPGKQSDYMVKASLVDWPDDGLDAECPVWDKFLSDILVENEEMVGFLQRLLGLSVIGKVLRGIFVVMSGRGRNGKGTIVETITDIMGPLAGAVRSEMLLDQGRIASSAGPTPDIMALRGKRLVFASETDENCRISPSRVKWLTGNDTLSGRNPNDKYEVNFKPTHSLFLQTNNDPHAPGNDFAFWERMVKIPFTLSFVNRQPEKDFEREADPELPEKLKAEYPAILAWLVRGCIEYQKVGLKRPAAVKEAIEQYQKEEDIIGDYIEDCCIVKEGLTVSAAAAYENFKVWWTDNVNKRGTPSKKKFGLWFGARFERIKQGTNYYTGVGLISDNIGYGL